MEQPSYYAIIPAKIRYDSRLTASEKLLYGEITAMCNQEGYCWATNEYFAELYGVSTRTARRWLENLEECGYITRDFEAKYQDERTNEDVRKIYLTDALTPFSPRGQKCPGGRTKMSGGADKNVRHNNINNNKKEYIKRAGARITQPKSKNKNQFQNFSQRDYDFETLEQAMFYKNKLEGDP